MIETNALNGARMAAMSRITSDDIAGMSPQDRVVLIGELWDSLDEADLPLTAAQSAELTRRLDSFEADRPHAVAWDDLKAELAKRCP
jgi:putative addiction module component (TIGR02574 family)